MSVEPWRKAKGHSFRLRLVFRLRIQTPLRAVSLQGGEAS